MQRIADAIIPILIAMFGGLVGTLQSTPKAFSIRLFVTGLVTAALAGFIIHHLAMEWGMSENYRVAAVALSGYCSRDVLAAIKIRFLKSLEARNDASNDNNN